MYQQPYPEGGQGPTQRHNTASISSLLVADCGAVFTKVSLFGLVEGQYRLLARGEAPTTATHPRIGRQAGAEGRKGEEPKGDITEGIIQAINEIEIITGRRFVEEK